MIVLLGDFRDVSSFEIRCRLCDLPLFINVPGPYKGLMICALCSISFFSLSCGGLRHFLGSPVYFLVFMILGVVTLMVFVSVHLDGCGIYLYLCVMFPRLCVAEFKGQRDKYIAGRSVCHNRDRIDVILESGNRVRRQTMVAYACLHGT